MPAGADHDHVIGYNEHCETACQVNIFHAVGLDLAGGFGLSFFPTKDASPDIVVGKQENHQGRQPRHGRLIFERVFHVGEAIPISLDVTGVLHFKFRATSIQPPDVTGTAALGDARAV